MFVVFIICFTLIYFYFIRDWRSKVYIDKETIGIIANTVNNSDFEFDEFTYVSKTIKDKYENMGYDVSIDDLYSEKRICMWKLISESDYNDIIYISFFKNNHITNDMFLDSSLPNANLKQFKRYLNTEYGFFRPIFTCFCNKKKDVGYECYFSPFCWIKDVYHLVGGHHAKCKGIMIFDNYTISIYYSSNDIENYNNLNSVLKDLTL